MAKRDRVLADAIEKASGERRSLETLSSVRQRVVSALVPPARTKPAQTTSSAVANTAAAGDERFGSRAGTWPDAEWVTVPDANTSQVEPLNCST